MSRICKIKLKKRGVQEKNTRQNSDIFKAQIVFIID